MIAGLALARTETAEDLMGIITFLSSSESDFIAGQTMVVDCGEVFSRKRGPVPGLTIYRQIRHRGSRVA
jgi:hypothetical protein